MPRATPPGTKAVCVYLPTGLVEALDAWAAERTAAGGPTWSRTDVMKDVLGRAVADHEARRTAPA